jgi:hypothetical protein
VLTETVLRANVDDGIAVEKYDPDELTRPAPNVRA